jgi:hypothetical protein
MAQRDLNQRFYCRRTPTEILCRRRYRAKRTKCGARARYLVGFLPLDEDRPAGVRPFSRHLCADHAEEWCRAHLVEFSAVPENGGY